MEATREPAPPVGRRLPYVPALDGLRAACLVAVLVYHGGFTWARGGFLGVSTFFTLSGFLITALLLVEVRATGRVDLGRFWAARVRRLLPAALVTLVLVVAFARSGASSTYLVGLRHDLWSTFGLVINWRLAIEGATYGNAAEASPFQHMWSLAVEEQFYLVLPLACLGGVVLARRTDRSLRVVLGWGAAALALASAIALATSAGEDVSFAYYATHTRAAELLVGVVLACTVHRLVGWRHRRRVVPVLGVASVAGMATAWVVVSQAGHGLYTGGMALYSLASAGTIVACLYPGPVRTVLERRPLRALGRISYGAYLYHWPIFCWLREDTVDLGQVPLFLLRVSLTVALAGLSYTFVEMPIRRTRRLPRIPRTAFAALAAVVVASAFAVPLRTVDTGPSGVEVSSGERVASAGGDAVPVSAVRPTPEIPPAERLLLVGDSVPLQLAPYVAEALPEVDVRFVGETGTGLLSHQGAIADQLQVAMADLDPDVVVVHFVGTYLRHKDGTEPYRLPDGTAVEDGSEEMFRLWEEQAEELVDIAGAGGAQVVWALIPQIQEGRWFSYLRDTAGRLNDIYRSLGVPVLDWYGLTSGPDGEFAEKLAGPTSRTPEVARSVDGLHFTAFGNRLLAASVAELVAEWPGRRGAATADDDRAVEAG